MKYLIWIGIVIWVVVGVLMFMPNKVRNVPVEAPKIVCPDVSKHIVECTDQSTGRKWLLLKTPEGVSFDTLVSTEKTIPYREKDLSKIACTFNKKNEFFCVNTQTGKIWTVPKYQPYEVV